MTVNEIYQLHLMPVIEQLAQSVYASIRKRRITALTMISPVGGEYKYGAYAVTEAWADLDEVIKPFFDYKPYGLNGTEYVELIDYLVDDLKKRKLIYMEW